MVDGIKVFLRCALVICIKAIVAFTMAKQLVIVLS